MQLKVAACLGLASLLAAWPAQAAPPTPVAAALADQGRVREARGALEAAAKADPARADAALEALLDLCIEARADDCLATQALAYADWVRAHPAPNPTLHAEAALKVVYYLAYSRFRSEPPATRAAILQDWGQDIDFNGALYLRRQALAAAILAGADRPLEAEQRIDRTLSLLATARNPQAAPRVVAETVSASLAILLRNGEAERAYGLLRAAGGDVGKALPPTSLQAAVFAARSAQVLAAIGDIKAARRQAEAAVAALRALDLPAASRARLLGPAMTLQAALQLAEGDLAAARATLAEHPYRSSPPAEDSAAFVTLRILAVAAAHPDDETARAVDSLARNRVAELRRSGPGPAGAWYRPDIVDRLLFAAALARKPAPEEAFMLAQLAARSGPVFDADALSALGAARDESGRRAIQQLLRLKARRDRLERTGVQRAAAGLAAPPVDALLEHDARARLDLRRLNNRIEAARRAAIAAGAQVSGAPVARLAELQAVLAEDEAALAVTPVPGGLAYVCLRRDQAAAHSAPIDAGQMRLDIRLVQAALTAGHAASEQLDAQYPVAAATRLYDTLIRPFGGCLRPGDRILWLSSVTAPGVPLVSLLAATPPKLSGGGFDLAAADWLVRAHAVAYVGSASALVAQRTGPAPAAPDLDFLGVGDPVLAGVDAAGAPRARAPEGTQAEIAALAALPETRHELEASARGFRRAQLLLQARATERAVRSELVGDYGYLSFATHGLIRDDLQGLSDPALVLTPTDARGEPEDGLLTASEIADLNFKARFVALSACNTANFDLSQAAQDLPALASAFAVAGVPDTLATLWPVDSRTGQQVVAEVFARLRDRPADGAAAALATAQRAFLAAPPGRAYLHPRFWAPFVILGDGGPPRAPAPAAYAATRVEWLTERGGEVQSLVRTPAGVVARYIGNPTAAGFHQASLLTGLGGVKPLRWQDADVGALPIVARWGAKVVAAGYRAGVDGRYAPVLQLFDGRAAAPARTWIGPRSEGKDALIAGAGMLDAQRAVVLVADEDIAGPTAPAANRLTAYEVDETLNPRALFAMSLPPAISAETATATPLPGGRLLVTASQRIAWRADRPPQPPDGYDSGFCVYHPVTFLDIRDAAGKLIRTRVLAGFVATAALPHPDGRVLLAGAWQSECGLEAEGHATVLTADASLNLSGLYEDLSLGASEVSAIRPLPDGGLLLAASKENVIDKQAADADAPTDLYAIKGLENRRSVMLVRVGADGRAGAPKYLDSGSDLFLSAMEASRPDDILLGGALGGRAAVIHLTTAGAGP